jgi:hypothetical protein
MARCLAGPVIRVSGAGLVLDARFLHMRASLGQKRRSLDIDRLRLDELPDGSEMRRPGGRRRLRARKKERVA